MTKKQTALETFCPHPKCGKPKEYDKFSCRPHWFQLPDDIKRDITRGWKYNRPLWEEARAKALEHWDECIEKAAARALEKEAKKKQLGFHFADVANGRD